MLVKSTSPFLVATLLLLLGFQHLSSSFNLGRHHHLPTASTSSYPRHQHRQVTMSAAVKARAKAAIIGGFVADAATMPLHWIYDAQKIKDLVTEGGKEDSPEFFEKPSCPFYNYPLGNFSPYGDEILPLLRSVAKVGGFDKEAFAAESYGFLKGYEGRLNHVSKLFVEARDAGKPWAECAQDDSQAHGMIKVPILVARYAGDSALLSSKVEEAVRVHQNNDVSVAASVALAKVLEKVVLGSTAKDAIEAVQAQGSLPSRESTYLEQAMSSTLPYPSPTVIKDFGMSCALPGAFLGTIYTAYHTSGYQQGVRSNILAGGDNCSRSIVLGAILAAAAQGEEEEVVVPQSWRDGTTGYAEVAQLANDIVESG